MEFGLFGYHGASTGSIAARADVPQPHLYASFATKQALFLACFDRLTDSLLQAEQERPSEDILRFLHQAVAAAAAQGLGEVVRPRLLELRSRAGEPRFDELLLAGGRALLAG